MKILYLIHQFYPRHYTGTEKFVLTLASMMQKWGHKVKVVTYSFQEDSFYDQEIGEILLKNYVYKSIPVIALRDKVEPDGLHYYLKNEKLSLAAEKILSSENPDIVHVAHPMRITELVSSLKRLTIPYIITLTDFWLMCPKGILFDYKSTLCAGPENGKRCRALCREISDNIIKERLSIANTILRGAQSVVSPSRFLAGVFQNEFKGLKVQTINHGISYRNIRKQKRTYTEGSELTFFYGGSLAFHKGARVLLDAFSKLPHRHVRLKLYGSGEPSYVAKLRDMVKNDPRVEFCGVFSEDQVGEIFNTVDVAVVPSLWYENYPLVLHEALACNIPVIASNIGGMAEKIKDGVNGLVFRVGDADDLRKTLEKVITNPAIINLFKQNLKTFFLPTIEQESYSYERLYGRSVDSVALLRE